MTAGTVSHMRPDPAYGVFDTLLVRDGLAVDLDAHVGRLAGSVLELYGDAVDAGALAARILTDAAGLPLARVRTSYSPSAPGWEIEALRIEPPGLDPRTLGLRNLPGGLGRHKWVDRAPVAVPPDGPPDVLLADDGGVLECGSANLVAVLDDVVVTPPLDGRILPGTVRARVLDQLRASGVPVAERPVSLVELAAASEVFTTSSIRGIQPVVGCAEVGAWPVGPLTMRLRA